jgi:hypothetical protein
MTTFKEIKLKSKPKTIDPNSDINILDNKNHIITLALYDNKDGTLYCQYSVTSAYFDNDGKKINRIISDTISQLNAKLAKENVIFINTLH